MPTVRKRSVEPRSASRRRDRDPDNQEPEDGVDAEPPDDETEPEEDDRETTSRSSRRESSGRSSRRSSSREPEEPEEPEQPEEPEERPSRGRGRGRGGGRSGGLGDGIRTGWTGADETLKAGGGGDRLTPGKEADLLKFLEPEPLVSCRQHWLATEAGGTKRPYVCPGKDCPICDLGDDPGPMYAFNVLHLNGGEEPRVRLLQIGTKAYQNLKEVSANKSTGLPDIESEFFSVQKTGTGGRAQTSFRPVKDRDLDDDWPEIFEHFDGDDLDQIIEDAGEHLYSADIVKPTSRKQLEEIARYLSDD